MIGGGKDCGLARRRGLIMVCSALMTQVKEPVALSSATGPQVDDKQILEADRARDLLHFLLN